MVKYYIITDTHSYYTEVEDKLRKVGFFEDKDAKLIVCGDFLDRGKEPEKMIELLLDIKRQGRLILIRGNHEDLFEDALLDIEMSGFDYVLNDGASISNGTVATLLALGKMTVEQAIASPFSLVSRIKRSDYYNEILPECKDYYETKNYVFTHGWIPSIMYRAVGLYDAYGDGVKREYGYKAYRYDPNWRNAPLGRWKEARFLNGMDMAVKHRVLVPNKTVVCGHYTTSYGHSVYGNNPERKLPRYDVGADFSPFISDGIIAIDGLIAHSGVVNCLVIKDEEL